MRLKAYTAATIAEAMQQIRQELGEDATIVATEADGNSVRVIAALDEMDPPPPVAARSAPQPVVWPTVAAKRAGLAAALREAAAASPERTPVQPKPERTPVQPKPERAPVQPKPEPAPAQPRPERAPKPERDPAVFRALVHHGVPESMAANLVDGTPRGATPAATLARRITELLQFGNLADRRATSPVLLAGPPGAGKTLVAAKLAANAALKGQAFRVITTDIDSAGAVEQLTAFTRPLQIELETADGPAALARLLAHGSATNGTTKPQVVIDTRGVNPFDAVEMAGLSALIVASRADATLVLPAGGDVHEAGEMAEAFAHIGCGRLVTTRLDIARRLGGIITAALVGRLALAETGASPIVAHGLQPLNPHLLARLFVADRPL